MQPIKKAIRKVINKKKLSFGIHKLAIKFGVHILPVHYYSPVPNILELERTRDVWAKKSEMPGVLVNLNEQASNLKAICMLYQCEYAGNKIYKKGVFGNFGPGYGYIEAQALHGFVRHYKPKQIVEVGSGVSTFCMLKASEMNCKETGRVSRIVSIDPYPSQRLREMPQITLIPQPVQTVPLDVFTDLGQNDILFIDSSHTVRPAGDVNYLILEVLPRLRHGVIVHFHDIFLPYDYQRNVDRTYFHWAETSLLHAYLIYNERAKIIACLSHLHYECKDLLREIFPEYTPQEDENGLASGNAILLESDFGHFPSSTYIQVQ